MATSVKLETIPWGKRVNTHEAVFFYGWPGWDILTDGLKWTSNGKPEEKRHLAPSCEVLEELVRTKTGLPNLGMTTATEEILGLDTEGRIGTKNQAVMLTLHGSGTGDGIILQSPQSFQKAYTERTPSGEPSVQQEKITAALSGILPNMQQIKVYTFQALMKENRADLPQVYAIAMLLKDVGEIQSGRITVDKLPKNNIYVSRAGHMKTAEEHAEILKRECVAEYGIHHALAKADPANKPSGRVLYADSYHHFGLDCSDDIYYIARFVGIRKLVGAEGAARQQA